MLALLALIVVAVTVRLIVPPDRRRRMDADLRRDWWPRFEREFRAYASRADPGYRRAAAAVTTPRITIAGSTAHACHAFSASAPASAATP